MSDNYKVTVLFSGAHPWHRYSKNAEKLKDYGKAELNRKRWSITPMRCELRVSLGRINGNTSDWKLIANLLPGEDWVSLPDQSAGVNPSGRAGNSQWALGGVA